MLTDEIEDVESTSVQAIREQYENKVANAVEAVGVDEAADATGVEPARLDALVAGESPTLTLSEAASLLALADGALDAGDIVAAVRDHLMLQMSSAVMDVDALATGLDGDLDPKEVQQKIEGRQPMTLGEYAQVRRYVASENPF